MFLSVAPSIGGHTDIASRGILDRRKQGDSGAGTTRPESLKKSERAKLGGSVCHSEKGGSCASLAEERPIMIEVKKEA